MKLYVLRHAHAISNQQHLTDAHPEDNWSLTKKGEEQAQQVAEQLKNIPFQALYVSDFKRTQETAHFINQYHHLQLIVDERLNEWDTGLNRQPVKEVLQRLDEAENFFTTSWNDGENYLQLVQRVHQFLRELQTTRYDPILIITHAEIVRIIKGLIQHLSPQQIITFPFPDNVTYESFELAPNTISDQPPTLS